MSWQVRTRVAGLALSALALAATAHAGAWVLAPGEYVSEVRGDFQSSGTAYDADGNRVAFGGLWESRAAVAATELGWRKHTSMLFTVPIQSVTVNLQGAPSPATSTGLGDFTLGVRRALWQGHQAAALSLLWTTPLGGNRSVFPGFGEGARTIQYADLYRLRSGVDTLADFGGGRQALEADLDLGWAVGHSAFVELGGGYRYDFLQIGARQDSAGSSVKNDWADHVTVAGSVGWWWTSHLQVAGLYRGAFNVATGRHLQNPDGTFSDTHFETTSHLAGVRVTYRVDERVDAVAGSWHSPAGTNVLHVDRFYAGVVWRQTALNRLSGFLGGSGK